MTTAERKSITSKVSESHVSAMTKGLLDALIEDRRKELEQKFHLADDDESKKRIGRKIEILKNAGSHEFHQTIQAQAETRLSEFMVNLSEEMVVNLNNAEYFHFSGRIR